MKADIDTCITRSAPRVAIAGRHVDFSRLFRPANATLLATARDPHESFHAHIGISYQNLIDNQKASVF